MILPRPPRRRRKPHDMHAAILWHKEGPHRPECSVHSGGADLGDLIVFSLYLCASGQRPVTVTGGGSLGSQDCVHP